MTKILLLIWYYISYPIRLYYRDRVSSYEFILQEIKLSYSTTTIKARRMGMCDINSQRVIYKAYIIAKLQRFINNWKIK